MTSTTRTRLRTFRVLCFSALLGATALSASVAHAGEVLFGQQPLAVGGDGKITGEGRKAAIKQIKSEPGEELWTLHLWAKVDKGAPGPLYVEFIGKLPDGKPYTAFSHEHSSYDGEPYVNLEIELDGNRGLNKGHTYKVDLTQQSDKGKTLQLASGSITLAYTEAPKEDDEGEEGETEGEDDDQTAEQDAIDSFAGGGGEEGGGPPPVEPPAKKKGCRVDPGGYGAPGILVLLALGAFVRRRR